MSNAPARPPRRILLGLPAAVCAALLLPRPAMAETSAPTPAKRQAPECAADLAGGA